MRALFRFLSARVDFGDWRLLGFLLFACIVALTAKQFFDPAPFFSTEGIYKGDTVYQIATVAIKLITLVILVIFIARAVLDSKHLFRAIRFWRLFGFWPASTENGMVGLKVPVFKILKEFAERLNRSCDAEERMSLELRNSDDPKHALALERNLRQNKEAIKDRRKEFYSRRNLAKTVGFETQKSYKDYLSTK